MKISAAALLAFSAVQAPFFVTTTSAESIVEFLANETNGLTGFYDSLVAQDLISTLEEEDASYTVFAIEEEYFDEDNKDADFRACITNRTSVLKYHIAMGTLPSDMLTDGAKVNFLNGEEGSVKVTGSAVDIVSACKCDQVRVVLEDSDNMVDNGIVHVVESSLANTVDNLECNGFTLVSSANHLSSFFGAAALMMTAGAFLAI